MPAARDLDPYENPLRFFGSEVRRQRERLKLNQLPLSQRLFCSDDLVSKIETGAAVPTPEFGAACDEVFGTHGAMEELARMVRRSMVFPSWIRPWVDAEQAATILRNWEPIVVSGLLQTADYARALLRMHPGMTEERVEELVAARIERQEILEREDPPVVWFLMDESVLHRSAGSSEVMRAQLQALVEAASRPNVTIQVVPLSAGMHLGHVGAFAVACFDGSPDMVYLESARAGQVSDRPEDVQETMKIWEAIRAEALPARASLDLIAKVAEEWT